MAIDLIFIFVVLHLTQNGSKQNVQAISDIILAQKKTFSPNIVESPKPCRLVPQSSPQDAMSLGNTWASSASYPSSNQPPLPSWWSILRRVRSRRRRLPIRCSKKGARRTYFMKNRSCIWQIRSSRRWTAITVPQKRGGWPLAANHGSFKRLD